MDAANAIPFTLAIVQWVVIPIVPTMVIRRTKNITGTKWAHLLDAGVILFLVAILLVMPIWLLDLIPLRGEPMRSYRLGAVIGMLIAAVLRWRLFGRKR